MLKNFCTKLTKLYTVVSIPRDIYEYKKLRGNAAQIFMPKINYRSFEKVEQRRNFLDLSKSVGDL